MNASFWGLIALLVLLAAAPFVARRLGRRRPAGDSGAVDLQVVGSVALGTQHRVVAIAAGCGSQRSCLVLGLAQGQLTLLHRFDAEPGSPVGASAEPAAPQPPSAPGWREIARRAGLPA